MLIFATLEPGLKGALTLLSFTYPKNPWDVGRGVKLPPVLKPFRGVIRRIWCFHRRGQDP